MAADALLERAPYHFVGKGGDAGCLTLKDGKKHAFCAQTPHDHGYAHAATLRLIGGTHRVQIGGNMDCFHVMLAAEDKDISKNDLIIYDADAWGLWCGGFLCSAGSRSACTPATEGELKICLDTAQHSAVFWQSGKRLGRVTGLPAAVKLVVCMAFQGQFATLLAPSASSGEGGAGAKVLHLRESPSKPYQSPNKNPRQKPRMEEAATLPSPQRLFGRK